MNASCFGKWTRRGNHEFNTVHIVLDGHNLAILGQAYTGKTHQVKLLERLLSERGKRREYSVGLLLLILIFSIDFFFYILILLFIVSKLL